MIMKQLMNLAGAQLLSKDQQKAINGGSAVCDPCAGKPIGALCFYGCHKSCPGNCVSSGCAPW